MSKPILAFAAAALMLAGCATPPKPALASASLNNTGWQLVEYQPSDGATATVHPGDPTKYQLLLLSGGQLAMKLDCNNATGKWSLAPNGINKGNLNLAPVAMTRAACANGSLDTQLARDMPRIRSYVLNGGRLDLTLDANGGTYSWQRIAEY